MIYIIFEQDVFFPWNILHFARTWLFWVVESHIEPWWYEVHILQRGRQALTAKPNEFFWFGISVAFIYTTSTICLEFIKFESISIQ